MPDSVVRLGDSAPQPKLKSPEDVGFRSDSGGLPFTMSRQQLLPGLGASGSRTEGKNSALVCVRGRRKPAMAEEWFGCTEPMARLEFRDTEDAFAVIWGNTSALINHSVSAPTESARPTADEAGDVLSAVGCYDWLRHAQ
jgi:hypothetical protein